jgi:hypothetical protein
MRIIIGWNRQVHGTTPGYSLISRKSASRADSQSYRSELIRFVLLLPRWRPPNKAGTKMARQLHLVELGRTRQSSSHAEVTILSYESRPFPSLPKGRTPIARPRKIDTVVTLVPLQLAFVRVDATISHAFFDRAGIELRTPRVAVIGHRRNLIVPE